MQCIHVQPNSIHKDIRTGAAGVFNGMFSQSRNEGHFQKVNISYPFDRDFAITFIC